jgi:ATP-dependent exoDNAse (exonuclease V) alpha subunit
MDEDQEQAFHAIPSGRSLLLTGQAGTGKSYVIKSAVKLLRKRGDSVALTCSTGIATSVFEEENACTLHKWAGLSDERYYNDQLLHLISTDEKYEKVKENILKVD